MKLSPAIKILLIELTVLSPLHKAVATEPVFPEEKLKPIVQLFGTASFDPVNSRYDYTFGRAHLGFQYGFNELWSAKIIIDRGRPTTLKNIKVTDTDGTPLDVTYSYNEGAFYTFWLKFASLQWKVNPRLKLEGGAILQNHYITQERFWGLRYVAQTFQDRYWKIPSSDLGFIARYEQSQHWAVDLALTNGEGPRVKQDANGNVKLAGGIDILPSQKFQSRLYYHHRRTDLGNKTNEQLYSVFAGIRPYVPFRLGAEFNYLQNMNYNQGLNSYGYSLYSASRLNKKTELFGRFDHLYFDANFETSNPSWTNQTALITGISHSPVQGINLSVNYQGLFSTGTNDDMNQINFSMEYKF